MKKPAILKFESLTKQIADTDDLYHRMIDEVEDYAIILLDTSGIIRNWNKGAQKIKQYQESEIVGKHFSIFYLPEDRAANLPDKLLNRAITQGRAVHEGWRLRKDQTRFWGSITLTAIHDEQGKVFGISKVTRDLTDKKLSDDKLKKFSEELQVTNDALKLSEERYVKMIAEVQDYAIILLDKDGNIQNWNAGAQNIKGYSASDIVGKNFRVFYRPEDQAINLPEKLINQAKSTGKAIHEGWRVRKNGTVFWGSIVITALHNSEGEVIGYSKVTRDLTERKQAEDQMRHYLMELEARNEELEQFTYIASHDLQEPLRKIQTFTEVIENNLSNKDLVHRYFRKINESSQRMSELIKSVLNYSRLSKTENIFGKTDLNKVMKSVLDDLELMINEKKAVVTYDRLPVLSADKVQMTQLFFNLVGNALKFNDKSPVVNIACEVVDRSEILHELSFPIADRYYKIAVKDNGIGFDQQYEHVIFNMFQRLHSKHEFSGTGIGLALCRKIVENHHGLIHADGEPGKGATFSLFFPVT